MPSIVYDSALQNTGHMVIPAAIGSEIYIYTYIYIYTSKESYVVVIVSLLTRNSAQWINA